MISTIVGKNLKSNEIMNYLQLIYLQIIVLVRQLRPTYLPYRGAIPFWFYLVPLWLVSIFLNVSQVEISCRLLPNPFFVDITIKLYYCQGDISNSILEKNY